MRGEDVSSRIRFSTAGVRVGSGTTTEPRPEGGAAGARAVGGGLLTGGCGAGMLPGGGVAAPGSNNCRALDCISEDKVEGILNRSVDLLKETNYENGKWYADYIRLRIKAIKK